jgi:hypothetical protein
MYVKRYAGNATSSPLIVLPMLTPAAEAADSRPGSIGEPKSGN